MLNGCFIVSFLFKFHLKIPLTVSHNYLQLLFAGNLVWYIVGILFKLYDIPRFSVLFTLLRRSYAVYFIHFSVILIFIFSFKAVYFSREVILIGYFLLAIANFFSRGINVALLKLLRRKGYNFKNVIIVGEGTRCNQLANYFSSDLSAGYNFLGFFHNKPEHCIPKNKVLGGTDSVEEFLKTNLVDELYCAFPPQKANLIRQMRTLAGNSFIRLKFVPDFSGFHNTRIKLDFYYDTPIISFRNEPLSLLVNQFLKRAFDIIFSSSVMILLLPVFLLISIVVKLSSTGPVFFKQARSGKENKNFICYKFRTMYRNDESNYLQASYDDPRITKIGKFLRRTNLDELPQFINVILGHMSVVGPRPHMLTHTSEYAKIINKFMVRHIVKPGITGWAQINGFRGPLDRKLMYQRVSMDVWYIENWSFFLDIIIIFRTVLNMLKGEKNAM